MNIKLLTKQPLEFLSLKGDCTGLSESTLAKIPHVTAHDNIAMVFFYLKALNIGFKDQTSGHCGGVFQQFGPRSGPAKL